VAAYLGVSRDKKPPWRGIPRTAPVPDDTVVTPDQAALAKADAKTTRNSQPQSLPANQLQTAPNAKRSDGATVFNGFGFRHADQWVTG
jgi:hypothetical protein